MIVLGVDTAGSTCAAALWRDGAVLSRRERAMVRGHAEVLMPMVVDMASEAGIALKHVDMFGITVGPGAFTGLRIGLAAVAGMALAAARPIVGVGRFEAFAAATTREERTGRRLLVAIDSRRTEPFVQTFDADLKPDGAPEWLAPAMLADRLPPGPLLVAGDAADAVLAELAGRADMVHSRAADRIDPAIVAAMAAARADQARFEPPAPAYLRPPDAMPGRGPRPAVPSTKS